MIEQKIQPQALEIEKAVLGAILLDKDAMQVVNPILHEKCFYSQANSEIWATMHLLYISLMPIDLITVKAELEKRGLFETIGGISYLLELTNDINDSSNIETYALIVKEKYIARCLITLQSKSVKELYEPTCEVFGQIESIMTELNRINTEINKLSHISFADKVATRLQDLKEAATNGYRTGVESGLNDLDRQTLGFQPSDLVIIAARPAMGKTALAVDMARRQAKGGKMVGIFSLEMSTEQLIDRIFSAETEIELQQIRRGGLQKQQWQRLDETSITIMGYPMFVSDRSGVTINDITSISKQWKLRHGLDIIYIDYLQLITGSGNVKGANREQEISEISRRLKILAKDLNIPVIALSQLSRKCEERADKRPMLSDLRESGAIEQDADMVIFPFCPSYYDETQDDELCEIDIAKYRNGKTGMIEVKFQKSIQKFSNKNSFDVF